MASLLVATTSGCRVFTESAEGKPELAGRRVEALALDGPDHCIAIVDESQVWRRDRNGVWSLVASTPHALQSIAAFEGNIYAGGNDEPVLLRISTDGHVERLTGFDHTPGREAWVSGGPPLGVRSLAATRNAVLAAVHVGGIPRSTANGESWSPTIPILHDAHEVCAHPLRPGFVAAAAAVGLCISQDSGQTWQVQGHGNESSTALAVAVLEEEVLFSVQNGPFAKQSQLWRWSIQDAHLEQVRDGLPEWLEGKVDTHWLVAGFNQAALIDKGGNLWWSRSGSARWDRITTIPPYVLALLLF